MTRCSFHPFYTLAFIFSLCFFTKAQYVSLNPKVDTLKVGVAGNAPFIINEPGNPLPQGISAKI